MTTFTIEMEGQKDTERMFKRLEKKVPEDVKAIVAITVTGMTRDAKKSIAEAGRVDTGAMMSGVKPVFSDAGFTGEVDSTVKYSVFQEFGTRLISGIFFMTLNFVKWSKSFKSDLEKLARSL